MNLSYKRDMSNNYMIPESEETLSGQDYQIHMMMENHVEGLLPCCIRKMNGQSRYFYDITSRQSMKSVYEKEYLQKRELRILLKGLYNALLEVKRFLLDADKVVLEPEMIYMDIETKEPLFTYLPSFRGDILSSFQEFSARLLQMLDQSDTDAVLLGYEVYRRSMEPNYSLERLLKEAAYGGEETRQKQQEERKTASAEVISRESAVPIVQEEQERSEPVRLKPEKQKAVFLRVKKKKLILLFPGIAVLAGIVIAAWYWKLNVTQIGGIAFLTASFLAWGISADGNRKKEKSVQQEKKERRADRRSVKKMKKMEEGETVRKETLPRQESVHKQEVLQKLEQMKHAESISEPEQVGATVLLCTGEEYVPHLSLISMNPRERNSVMLLNDTYTVGKLKSKVDIYIDHPSISRIHARISKEGNEYFLQDLNSTNGTFVNGRRLSVNERVQIQLSDEIRFADLGYYVGKC